MIGIIDSGSGGVNVIKECMKFYNEDFIYLIDNQNCPYGNKDITQIKNIVIKNIKLLLKKYDLDLIILACNTASAVISVDDTLNFKIPILKTYPDLKNLCKSKNSLLFATKNTIERSNLVKYYRWNYPHIKCLHIKNLAKEIDENLKNNYENNEKIQKILKKSLIFNKKIKNKYKNIDCIALGCTHFKHIKNQINNVFYENIRFFECEKEIAFVSKFLIRKNKKQSTFKIILTKEDFEFERKIKQLLELNV